MAEVAGTGAGTITSGQRILMDVATARRVPQYLKLSFNVSKDIMPLYSLIKEVGIKKTVADSSYFHLEDDYNPITVTVGSSALNTTDTAWTDNANLVADMYKRVNIGTILKCLETGECILVTDISSGTLTVYRGYGGTGAVEGTTGYTIPANAVLRIIGSSHMDGATAGNGISSEPTIKTNYMQIVRQPWELSGRDIEGEVYGKDESDRIQEAAMEAMQIKVESMLLLNNGIKAPATSGSSASGAGMSGGLPYWLTSNVTNVNGTLNETTLNTIMATFARRNNKLDKDCVIMAGENFCKALDGFQRDYLRIGGNDKIYGVTANTIRSFNGDIKVVRHGMLSVLGSDVAAYAVTAGVSGTDYASTTNGLRTPGNQAYGLAGLAYFLNLKKLGLATFKNRDLKLRQNIETPGTDGKKWEYLQDVGCVVATEKAHCIAGGITG